MKTTILMLVLVLCVLGIVNHLNAQMLPFNVPEYDQSNMFWTKDHKIFADHIEDLAGLCARRALKAEQITRGLLVDKAQTRLAFESLPLFFVLLKNGVDVQQKRQASRMAGGQVPLIENLSKPCKKALSYKGLLTKLFPAGGQEKLEMYALILRWLTDLEVQMAHANQVVDRRYAKR